MPNAPRTPTPPDAPADTMAPAARRTHLPALRAVAIVALMLLVAGGLNAQVPEAGDAPHQEATAAEAPAEPELDPAELEAVREQDRILRERLRARLAVIPGLEKAEVEVSGGGVRLRGEALDDGRRQLAETIASQMSGVVGVDNQLGIDTDVRVRTRPVLEHAAGKLRQLVAALPLLLLAAAIVFAADRLGRWLATRQRLGKRAGHNPFLASLIRQAIRLGILLAGVLVALDLLNATALVGALLGTAGVVGIAVGFAFRDVAENYIAGILLSLRQPFAPHDHVVIDGHEGMVAALTTRATILVTPDGNHLRLPNALVFKGVMLNYSRNPRRRFNFDIGIANEASVSRAQQIVLECLGGIEALLQDPAPSVLLAELDASSTRLRVSAWVDQRSTSFGRARSESIRLVRRALEKAGVDLPDPSYRVALAHTPTGTPPAPTQAEEEGREGDLSAERHLDRQIEQEEASFGRDNLLDPNAPRE